MEQSGTPRRILFVDNKAVASVYVMNLDDAYLFNRGCK